MVLQVKESLRKIDKKRYKGGTASLTARRITQNTASHATEVRKYGT